MNGNKAAAKKLSLAAHNLNTQLSNLNSVAATRIFQQRNSNLANNSEPVVDLHGLHPNEAIDILNETIRKYSTSGFRGKIVIVTGTGHHSRGNSKLLPAVRAFLQQGGYRPRDATISDGRGGILTIEI